ncbi:MAG: hypothetical protein R2816_06770 [Flavobacteriaceae bacterium]|nr:hypothetical protein [Flavobacteriaceae bacterium]
MESKNKGKKEVRDLLIKYSIDGCERLNKSDLFLDEIRVPIKVREGINKFPLRIKAYSLRSYSNPLKIKKIVEIALSNFREEFKKDKSLCYLDIIISESLHPRNRGELDLIDLTKQ